MIWGAYAADATADITYRSQRAATSLEGWDRLARLLNCGKGAGCVGRRRVARLTRMPRHFLQGLQPRTAGLLEGTLLERRLGALRLRCASPAIGSNHTATHEVRGSIVMQIMSSTRRAQPPPQSHRMAL